MSSTLMVVPVTPGLFQWRMWMTAPFAGSLIGDHIVPRC